MPMFDSSLACLPGLRFWLPGPVRRRISPGCRRGLSVLARAVSRRAFGSWTTPGLAAARAYAPASVAFPLQAHGRRPEFVFRSSIPRPSMPLSTLHPVPHGTQRKTRGQDGSLLLSCGALSSPTARRFIPTIALAHARGSEACRSTIKCFLICSAEPRGLCGDPRIFDDLTKVPQVFRNPGGSTVLIRHIRVRPILVRGFEAHLVV